MRYRMLVAVLVILAVLPGIFIYFVYSCKSDWCLLFEWQKARFTNSFEQCVARGYPVSESYPWQCRAGDKVFIEGRSSQPFASGIRGQVTIGPTCPVVRYPDDGSCADKPYVAAFNVYAKSGSLVSGFSSGQDGRFEVSLSPGVYTIRSATSSHGFPAVSPVEVTVNVGQMTEVHIQLDSGIR